MRTWVLVRNPPGDKWLEVTDDGVVIGPEKLSLTEALNHIYLNTGCKQFFIDAEDGKVHMEDNVPEPIEVKRYDIYGERSSD